MKTIIRNQVICKECDTCLVSKYPEDIQVCSCGSISIKGGNENLIRVGDSSKIVECSVILFDGIEFVPLDDDPWDDEDSDDDFWGDDDLE